MNLRELKKLKVDYLGNIVARKRKPKARVSEESKTTRKPSGCLLPWLWKSHNLTPGDYTG